MRWFSRDTSVSGNSTKCKGWKKPEYMAYAPRIWNELPDNIKAADSV